ncbi:XRE family transcriptional regulator [Vreelandella aquamarina]|uniref:Cupin domain-containing protein n=1 Tax=Vreelandella aquamarina TaxID=77097 RepID=A0A1N6DX46_9GAMM|nr:MULTISPECIES: XRE family transcriptional regulator [Halomonas]SEN25398.1 Cupin domain-containing protein [Halomonas aquamarina]SIN63305.1 transcriptional regulator, XRE family with cupin sensor [Halomonas meridiana]SIN75332.1 transcriptional regulator, XRE family with cupin sensor [Halomonas meridiana]SIO14911.1 transcriptional regulator, XRE family with cupin sensor [Halomonas meridiana]GED44926.1 XRE family transcriptional regulator [Halomonas meridiana]
MASEPHTIAQHIAGTVRQLRKERGWSLDRAAGETGVSKAMLGQIERGESSPTVSTLWKIASGFRVSFSTLFDSDKPALGELHRDGWESVWGDDSVGMQARLLFPYDPLLGFEMFMIELAPGALSESSAHASGVVEHIVVVEGEMELRIDERWQTLRAGEGLRFFADRPHAMRNNTATRLRFHDVIHYLPGAASGT